MIELALIEACSSDVAPSTITEIIRVESAGNPLALNVNGLPLKQQPIAETQSQAAEMARYFIENGHSVDMGLMQINSENLEFLGFNLESLNTLFSPCINIHAGAEILKESYQRAVKIHGEGQKALQAALSAYNTGNFKRGLSNGYVSKIYGETNLNKQYVPEHIIHAQTVVNWSPPENYYPKKKEQDAMSDNKKPEIEEIESPSREELDAFNHLEFKQRMVDLMPGVGVEFDPEEAEQLGAFEEDAMSLEDAIEASYDVVEVDDANNNKE